MNEDKKPLPVVAGKRLALFTAIAFISAYRKPGYIEAVTKAAIETDKDGHWLTVEDWERIRTEYRFATDQRKLPIEAVKRGAGSVLFYVLNINGIKIDIEYARKLDTLGAEYVADNLTKIIGEIKASNVANGKEWGPKELQITRLCVLNSGKLVAKEAETTPVNP